MRWGSFTKKLFFIFTINIKKDEKKIRVCSHTPTTRKRYREGGEVEERKGEVEKVWTETG